MAVPRSAQCPLNDDSTVGPSDVWDDDVLVLDADSFEIAVEPPRQGVLGSILADLVKLRNAYIFDIDELSRSDAKERLEAIIQECTRIRDCPELFESTADRDQFFDSVNYYSRQIVGTIKLWKQHHSQLRLRLVEIENDKLAETRQPFTDDRKERPWSQFLKNGGLLAPGPIKPPVDLKILSRQAIPEGGVRLITRWTEEIKQIYDYLDAMRDGPSLYKPWIQSKLNKGFKAKDGNFCRFELHHVRDAFKKHEQPLIHHDVADLAVLGKDLHRYEEPMVAYDNGVFTVYAVCKMRDRRGALMAEQ